MTSLIEQAAQRLEQLRQAGVVLPGDEQTQPAAEPAIPAAPAVAAPVAAAAPAAIEEPARPVGISVQPSDDGLHVSSKRVELDVVALAAQGFLMPHTPRSQTGDQYRVIKRPLIKNAMGKGAATINHANLLMVTSALAGEGKSFTSINLALSIAAELDNTVMLVDADVARPSVLRMLGLPQGPGLLDVLEERVEMSDVLLRTNVEKLTILPSGTPHPRATELLASDAMSHLLENMARRYPDRIIIFDSPPLLLTSESHVLASNMGQIVLVVESERTTQHAVKESLRQLEGLSNVNLIYNKSREFPGTESYDYHYG